MNSVVLDVSEVHSAMTTRHPVDAAIGERSMPATPLGVGLLGAALVSAGSLTALARSRRVVTRERACSYDSRYFKLHCSRYSSTTFTIMLAVGIRLYQCIS